MHVFNSKDNLIEKLRELFLKFETKGYYNNIENDTEKDLYLMAKHGNDKALKIFMQNRIYCVDERWMVKDDG